MGRMVSYPSDGGIGEGYLAWPAYGASGPAVLVIQEWWGLVPHIISVVDRFAAAGFVAFAPDLRQSILAAEPEQTDKLLTGPAMDQAAGNIVAAADYLAGQDGVTGQVGCVGFRAGGSLALWSVTRSARIVATVGFYPVLPWEGMAPDWPDYADRAAMIHCSGADGTSATHPGVRTVCRAIGAAGGHCVLHDYPGTACAFFNDDRPETYDQRAATSAWARTLGFLRSRLG